MRANFAVGVIAFRLLPVAWSQNQSGPVPVLGVHTGVDANTGARPSRLNINDLYARGGPQWDLYVQALSKFQAVPEADELSYFQISGIHGLPFVPWNGAEQVPDGPNVGYCPHGEVLFPTWHRPFVALFEQVLLMYAQRIANQYPPKLAPLYQAAAKTLRQPYWDWAAYHSLPRAAILRNLTINGPNGPSTIRNPLSSYQFQIIPLGSGFSGPLATYPETVRCPVEGGSDMDSALSDTNLNLPALGLTSMTYDVFTKAQGYESMASASSPGPSFEAPHNNIHNYAGCPNGTLADIGWSAFDPLFMLHHANVDRLIAMWQAIHFNNSTMNTTAAAHGTFGTKPGTMVNADSPLKPFFDSRLNYHTSKTASHTNTFGYTYPEIDDWSKTPEELAAYVTSRVNDLYGQGVSAAPKGRVGQAAAKGYTTTPKLVDYAAEIRVDRSKVPLPCSISLRLGNHVLGVMTLLAMPIRGVSYASIPLRDSLQRLNLKNMPEDALVPYLQRNLAVELRENNGSMLSARDTIPGLRVELQGRDFVPRESEFQLPRYGAARKWLVTAQPV